MFSILLLLPITLALSSHNRAGPRVAGVNQVSSADDSHRLRYAFNASEAREVCRSLGLTIASKAQVQSALTQGFQTCRFGWIDEHFAVVPRVTPSSACGHGNTGLVEWRTSVRKHFDVFCFNGSDAGPQLEDTTAETADGPVTDTEQDGPPSQQDATLTSDPLPSTLPPSSSSSSSLPSTIPAGRPVSSLALNSTRGGRDLPPEPELFVSLRQDSLEAGPRVAGVNQVSSADDSHRLRYAFNASEAREVCRSLGLTIASKAQVQSALTQGFQTCRFGWIDEHFAVVPRVTPSSACGHGNTGLVEWRTSVRKHFDVFCFNGSDAGPQLEDTTAETADSPVTDTEQDGPPSQQDATLTSDPLPSTLPPSSSSSSSLPSTISAGRPVSSLALNSTHGGRDPPPGPELFVSLRRDSLEAGPRVAGVNQVSSADDSHRLRYAFNASEAREVCRSLGLTIASKAQVQSALTQGFQTCRFGWIDEHFAVVPRVTPSSACGHGKTGLVEWRTSVRKHFDVFCFNESDAGPQLEDTTAETADSPVTDTEQDGPPSQQDATLTSDPLPSTLPASSSSSSSTISAGRPVSSHALNSTRGGRDPPPWPELFVSLRQDSLEVPTKSLLIGVTCALLLVIAAMLGLEEVRNQSCFQNWDRRPQEDVETEENTCVVMEEPFTEGPAAEETEAV